MSAFIPTVLFVTRETRGSAASGDQVLIRRMIAFLARRYRVVPLELRKGGPAEVIRHLAIGWLPELSGYATARNRAALTAALREERPSQVILTHESLFPLARVVSGKEGLTLFAMNSPSRLAGTDPSSIQRLLQASATAYERRYFFRPGARLILVSSSDGSWLAKVHGKTFAHQISLPGAPPRQPPLAHDAALRPDLIVSGTYDWWRKRRDLRHFASSWTEGQVMVTDPRAATAFGPRAQIIDEDGMDFGSALRFGLITDRFSAGFKLKAVQYVADNCVVVTLSDITSDFAGLPHADRFVRFAPDAQAVRAVIDETLAASSPEMLDDFRTFKAACMARFDWDACLAPLDPTPN